MTRNEKVLFTLNSFVRMGRDQDGNPAEEVVYFVEAATAYGHVFCHNEIFQAYEQEKALDFLNKVATTLLDATSDDLDSRYWSQRGFHVYGSEAYQAEGGEQELAKFCVEAYEGAGAYTPNHPEYIG
jgi:hypothetical protein